MLDHISPSQMSMAFQCGEKWRMRYVEGIKSPPALSMARGLAVHRASEENLTQKKVTEKDLPLGDLQDCARDGFVAAVSDGVLLVKDELQAKSRLLNETLNQTLQLTEAYRNDVAPGLIDIVDVEKPFNVYAEDVDAVLVGRQDVKTSAGIHDLKVTGTSMPAGQITAELQPAFYGLVESIETGQPETDFYIENLVATTTPKVQRQTMRVGPRHHDAIKRKIRMFQHMVKSGTFLPPAPLPGWVCTPKYCGYHGICNYTR